MEPAKILVVDDDPAIRNLIHRYLSQQNYQVQSAEDGKSALASFDEFSPQLVVLDVKLPDTTGFQLCKEMQSRTNVFVLMLTSLTGVAVKIEAFEQGADDFITKPFDLLELQARVKAKLKCKKLLNNWDICFGDLIVNPVSRTVTLKGELVSLTTLEFDLLYCLANTAGSVWERPDLIRKVWDVEYVGDGNLVNVHIGHIRQKIEPDLKNPIFIKTVHGKGYKFEYNPD